MPAARTLRLLEPVRLRSKVVHGFGRGSKQLGFPTANMRIAWEAEDQSALTEEELTVLGFAQGHETGVYCAFGCVESDPERRVHKVAMSMGWNPTFTDVKAKTIEPWIMHSFAEDFYGSHLRLLVLGYVRPELKFSSLEELTAEISADGDFCRDALDDLRLAPLRADPWLTARASPAAPPESPRRRPAAGAPRPAPPALAALLPRAGGGGLREALRRLPPLGPGRARVLLVRHGEAVANQQGRLCGGGTDSELSALGRGQAGRLAAELAGAGLSPSPALVGSSRLRRAADTADALAGRFPGAERATVEDLHEMMYGLLEGVPLAEAGAQVADAAALWRGGHTSRSLAGDAGAESPEAVLARALRALGRVLRGRAGQCVLLVCHAWVCKVLIAAAVPGLGLARLLDVPQQNCAVNVLDFACDRAEPRGASPACLEVLGVNLVAEGAGARL